MEPEGDPEHERGLRGTDGSEYLPIQMTHAANKRSCVSTASRRWQRWGSVSYLTAPLPRCTVSASRRWSLRIGGPPRDRLILGRRGECV